LTGLDGGLITGRRKSAVRYVEGGKTRIMRGDNTGKVTSVNGSLLKDLLGSGYLPVVTIPIGDENDHGPLNADCDRVAAAVAGTLKADKLVLLTNQPGLLKDPEDPGTLIRQIPAGSIDDHMKYARGRMKRKMIGAKEAIDGGVSNIFISSSEIRDPITTALEGGGTSIC
jgi:acetylglutamate/LysW-gamma-L-alpha-aminoadipate kinase